MQNSFFTQSDFNKNYGKEMESALSVYEQRQKSGMREYSMALYDFVFISDTEQKLQSLAKLLSEDYNYRINAVTKCDGYYELTGDSTEFPVDENNLMYWALDLYCKGYAFDCKLDGYGAIGDPDKQVFPDMDTTLYDRYFDLAMEAYGKKNLGMTFIHLSTAIRINTDDPNAWFSRAVIKDELYTWKSARRDYDKAIELAPDFIDAIVNRAANKDESGEYLSAIEDYTMAIALDAHNAMAYFNRGNSKFNINDKQGACEDWHMAEKLGANYAQERINANCTNIY